MNSNIKIMTDSASDIPRELEEELGIQILSFPITVGDDGYLERVDFTSEEFYDILLSASKIPATSQITTPRFCDEFTAVKEAGFDEVIFVSICGSGSSTYSSAVMAREQLYEEHPDWKENFRIHLVDSRTYSLGYGYPVIEAARKVQRGASSTEILAYLDDWFNSAEIYLAPYSLEFAKKSGRIPCAAAFVGELMGLKPIISMIDGKTTTLEKVRGDKAVIPALLKRAQAAAIPQTPYCIVGAMLPEETEKLRVQSEKTLGWAPEGTYLAGAAITINAGPKIVAMVVKGKNRKQ